MKKKKILATTSYLMLLFAVSYYSCVKDKAKLPVVPVNPTICDTMNVSFKDDVQPRILWTNCATSSGCHAGTSVNGNFADYDGIKDAAAAGKIRDRVINKKDMPPPGVGGPLPDSLMQIIDCWLKDGYPNN